MCVPGPVEKSSGLELALFKPQEFMRSGQHSPHATCVCVVHEHGKRIHHGPANFIPIIKSKESTKPHVNMNAYTAVITSTFHQGRNVIKVIRGTILPVQDWLAGELLGLREDCLTSSNRKRHVRDTPNDGGLTCSL